MGNMLNLSIVIETLHDKPPHDKPPQDNRASGERKPWKAVDSSGRGGVSRHTLVG